MKYYYILTSVIICLLLAGCNTKSKHNADKQSEFYTIDFEQSFDTERQMFMSEIADSVEYIELKTPDNVVITRIWDIKQISDYLIIKARLNIYLFHMSGRFIRQIGARGQGPGEYVAAGNVEIDHQKKEIVIADTRQLLFYDLDGNFLRNKIRKDAETYIGISDTILWIAEVVDSANSKYKAVAISSRGEGDTLAYIPNPLYKIINSKNVWTISTGFTTLFYHKDDLLYFNGDDSNDTIWRISGIHAEPYAFIDMGKYKLPVEFEAWYSSYETYLQHCDKYWGVSSLIEDERYFFLFSQNRKYSKANPVLKYIVHDKKRKPVLLPKMLMIWESPTISRVGLLSGLAGRRMNII